QRREQVRDVIEGQGAHPGHVEAARHQALRQPSLHGALFRRGDLQGGLRLGAPLAAGVWMWGSASTGLPRNGPSPCAVPAARASRKGEAITPVREETIMGRSPRGTRRRPQGKASRQIETKN